MRALGSMYAYVYYVKINISLCLTNADNMTHTHTPARLGKDAQTLQKTRTITLEMAHGNASILVKINKTKFICSLEVVFAFFQSNINARYRS